ncbi:MULTISPECIES: hypothetical protein [unclassified Caballeronia]|uniref:hypothetical protein n=1 Tax=unclassified Caballeronia TaxID=2646786 RepID=UPI00254240B6|nr:MULTISPECIES: hypothetical protein [unclassified Caballeronia]
MKQHLQSAIFTLLERGVSQHRIHELTGIDRKTIRRYQALYEARRADGAKSSTAATTGSGDPEVAQNPPLPRPPAPGDRQKQGRERPRVGFRYQPDNEAAMYRSS